ncbi:MAG: hypothetical protein HDS30_03785 [Bacteroides sp.]|nr:hypothetical protein [Bacteroides sp.]
MKKILIFALALGLAAYCTCDAKTIRKYYGTNAVQSDVNPCDGPTVRVCAEIIIDDLITTGTGDEVNVTIKRYGADGSVTSVETFTSTDYLSSSEETAKILENFYDCPPNATITIE